MSVIVRDLQYDTLMLLCKGADSVIKQRLNLEDFQNNAFMSATQIKVDSFANEGLRTLLLASKPLDELFYNQWNAKFQAALGEVIGKDTKIEQLQEEIETQMWLVGATAIEDKLQEEVPETITALKSAGIKVWVLTGDKVETAINIGYSSGLLDNQMTQYVIVSVEKAEITAKLNQIEVQI